MSTFLQADVIVTASEDDFAVADLEVRLFNTDAIKGMQRCPNEAIAIGAQDFGCLRMVLVFPPRECFPLDCVQRSGAAIPPGDEGVGALSRKRGPWMTGRVRVPWTNVVSNASNENVSTVALQLGQMTVNCPEDLDGDGLCDGCVGGRHLQRSRRNLRVGGAAPTATAAAIC